jgi:hypothetical protein
MEAEAILIMERSIKVVAVLNMALFAVLLAQHLFQFRPPEPWKILIGLIIPAIGLTWAYVSVGSAVLWLIGEGVDATWMYAWVIISGAFILWFLVSLIRFLFP